VISQAAVVFTFKSIERILTDGGTQSWRMNRAHMGTFGHVITCRNQSAEAEGPEPHGSAFLIGKVRDIVPSTEPHAIVETQQTGKQRYLIRMTEAALIPDRPGIWQWGRWPMHIDTLAALGIDPNDYVFKPLEELLSNIKKTSPASAPGLPPAAAGFGSGWRERIDRAKVSLAADLGVDPGALEITVRL
jgi:hypothetical protein